MFPLRRPRLSRSLRQHDGDSRRLSRHHVAPAFVGDDVIRQRLAVLISHLVATDNRVHLDDAADEAGRDNGVGRLSSAEQRFSHRHSVDGQNDSTEIRCRRIVVEANRNRKSTAGSRAVLASGRHLVSITSPNMRGQDVTDKQLKQASNVNKTTIATRRQYISGIYSWREL